VFVSGGNYLADVDPTLSYPLMVDYAHPLDPWGTHLGRDVGTTCYWGVGNITNTLAYKSLPPREKSCIDRSDMEGTVPGCLATRGLIWCMLIRYRRVS
jgi:hypothetical protein